MKFACLLGLLGLVGCLDGRSDALPADGGSEAGDPQDGGDPGDAAVAIDATVTVDLTSVRAVVPPQAYGLHASVYDNALRNAALPALLNEAGITLLRYPGGGYSDNYHWSNHSMTPFRGDSDDVGYLADDSDFGSFVALLESFDGTAMITVNYGSNLAGTGPGEPLEAAAWVAYANGDPSNVRALGVDGSGVDWQTIGYWASLRGSAPLASDDGRNFLRISHPEPLGIEYWEVGNEIFGNGYYSGEYEHDAHVPYDGTPRLSHPALSGGAYGRGVISYIDAMKAVDPEIKIGAVLNTPPGDLEWGRYWNDEVLGACGPFIDFGVVHWYPAVDPAVLLAAPRTTLPTTASMLRSSFERYAGANAQQIEITMTELGPGVGHMLGSTAPQAMGMFAADSYLTGLEQGFANLDWLELHNGTFLSERSQNRGPAHHGIRLAWLLARPGDTLVSASSGAAPIVAHAARRTDGRIGVLLIDTQPPGSLAATITVNVTGAPLAAQADRYDYAAPSAEAGGSVVGPTRVAGIANPLTLELQPYSAVLLVFDP